MHINHKAWAQQFADLVKKHLGDRLKSIVLYGSVAAGKEKPDSDIDLLIIAEGLKGGNLMRRRVLNPIHDEWLQSPRQLQGPPFISTILKTPEEAKKLAPIYFDMVDRNEIFFDRNGFMKDILWDVKKRLERLGARRKKIGKLEYWDLKPDYKPGEVFEI